MNDKKEQQHIALVFSIIFPGAGLLFLKKWFSGIVHGLIHLILMGFLLRKVIEITYYGLVEISRSAYDIKILVFLVIGVLLNWVICILYT